MEYINKDLKYIKYYKYTFFKNYKYIFFYSTHIRVISTYFTLK